MSSLLHGAADAIGRGTGSLRDQGKVEVPLLRSQPTADSILRRIVLPVRDQRLSVKPASGSQMPRQTFDSPPKDELAIIAAIPEHVSWPGDRNIRRMGNDAIEL